METRIAVIGIILMGYHWEERFYAFKQPTFTNVSFTLVIIFWSLMVMIVLKMWVQSYIRDKWKEKNIKRLKVVCIICLSFCIGSVISILPYLITSLFMDDIIKILLIPFMGTILYALREDKNSGWIGGDPSKKTNGGDIDH